MTSATIETAGIKNAITALRKLEPETNKAFRKNVRQIAAPAVDNVRSKYPSVYLSGLSRNWAGKARGKGPLDPNKARRGVRVVFSARRNTVGVILIEQADPATAIFEGAGRANPNRLSQSLDSVDDDRGWAAILPGRTRIIGKAVYQSRRRIEAEIEQAVLEAVRYVERNLS